MFQIGNTKYQSEKLCVVENCPCLPTRRDRCKIKYSFICQKSNNKYHALLYKTCPQGGCRMWMRWGGAGIAAEQPPLNVCFCHIFHIFLSYLLGKIWRRWKQTALENIARVHFLKSSQERWSNRAAEKLSKKARKIQKKSWKETPIVLVMTTYPRKGKKGPGWACGQRRWWKRWNPEVLIRSDIRAYTGNHNQKKWHRRFFCN